MDWREGAVRKVGGGQESPSLTDLLSTSIRITEYVDSRMNYEFFEKLVGQELIFKEK
jgi:hypothetical protein